jgi:prepilin-type N-terminal cleavage/methylation domain-containing protein
MKPARPHSRFARTGYTLIEVLIASGLIAAAIGAASKLSMTMTQQEEMARSQACAIRYAEAVARLWQLGVTPSSVLLTQTQDAIVGESGTPLAMSYSISTPVNTSMGSDGGIAQGTVEQATVSITYTPYGSPSTRTLSLDVLRPVADHR